MKTEYRYLTNIPIEDVQKCMQESFADYQLDMSYMTVETMQHRNKISRINPDYSVGAFDGNRMIGFINVGIDELSGEFTAFDGGTGVVKEYRGQGVAGGMFRKVSEKLLDINITRFTLEVLQDNKAAIRAYQKEGFNIDREFYCYNIAIKNYKGTVKELPGVEVKSISVDELEKHWYFLNYQVSWEHMFSGIKAVEADIVIDGAYSNGKCVGFIIYTPFMCWITSIGIDPSYPDYDELVDLLIYQLFNRINPVKPKVAIGNLLPEDKLNGLLVQLGFENDVNQYEMSARLNNRGTKK